MKQMLEYHEEDRKREREKDQHFHVYAALRPAHTTQLTLDEGNYLEQTSAVKMVSLVPLKPLASVLCFHIPDPQISSQVDDVIHNNKRFGFDGKNFRVVVSATNDESVDEMKKYGADVMMYSAKAATAFNTETLAYEAGDFLVRQNEPPTTLGCVCTATGRR